MKNKLWFIALLLFVAVDIFTFCQIKEGAVSNSPDPDVGLPAETTTGANTFGCLLNGKPFVAPGDGYTGPGPAYTCTYKNVNGAYYFYLSAVDQGNTGTKIVVGTTQLPLTN